MLLVAVEGRTPGFPSKVLRERFGLTKQRTAVTLLLAQGRSSVEIAEELVISRHTVRRHMEKILPKLGVRSRAEVRARIPRG